MLRTTLSVLLLLPGAVFAQGPGAIRASDGLMQRLNATTTLITSDTLRLYFRHDSLARLGSPVDTRFHSEFSSWYRGRIARGESDFFAIARVPLGDGVTAYVVRAPSHYASTAIDIWPFDSATGTLGPPIRVADAYGDPMRLFFADAWLVDIDADGVRDIVQRRRDAWEDDETGEKHRSDSLFVTLRRDRRFQRRTLSTAEHLLRAFDIPDWGQN